MTDNDPAGAAFDAYTRSFECIVSSTEPLLGRVEDAFRGGWLARETAPNTLIIDTTHARMVPIAHSATAMAPPSSEPSRVIGTGSSST